MDYSKTLSSIAGSATSQIFAKAKQLEKQGKDIIHLEIGQPDFKPHKSILDATSEAVQQGFTSYTVSRGTFELREAVGNYHLNTNNIKLNPEKEIIITAGAKLSIFASLWTLTNPGDNIIVLNPSWVSYADIVGSIDAEVRFIAINENFEFDEQLLRSKIDNRTKAILLNSPSNPTGAMISRKYLQLLYDIVAESNIYLISDEIYSEFTYDSNHHNSLLNVNNWIEHGIVVNGFAKTFSMTGFRLGYTLAKEEIINYVNKVNQLTASCPVNFAQKGGIAALANIDEMRKIINELMPKRRKLTIDLLSDLPVNYIPPQGAIYSWIGVKTDNSKRWAQELLEAKGVAITPGVAFGPDGESYFRLSFANPEDKIEEGIDRIADFLKKN